MRQKTVRKYYGYPKKCDREFDIFHKYDNWATTQSLQKCTKRIQFLHQRSPMTCNSWLEHKPPCFGSLNSKLPLVLGV